MLRSRALHTFMPRLALSAVLLLALLPTFGRLLQPLAQGMPAGLEAICTTAGLKYVDLALFGSTGAKQGAGQDRSTHGHDGFDCEYCPLLASLAVAVLWLALAGLQMAARPLPLLRGIRLPRRFLPCGLGSRGPPLVL